MSVAFQKQWLSFSLGNQYYAAPLRSVSEVAKGLEITEVPGAPREVLGVCQMRGQIFPVVCGRRRLGFDDALVADPAMVIVHYGLNVVGLLVDAVSDMLTIDEDSVTPPPLGTKRIDDPVSGVINRNGTFVALVDIDRLFPLDNELKDVTA